MTSLTLLLQELSALLLKSKVNKMSSLRTLKASFTVEVKKKAGKKGPVNATKYSMSNPV